MNAINFLVGALVATILASGQLMVEEVRTAITLFQIITTADFWKGMGDAIMGIAEGFIAFLLNGIGDLLDKMRNIPQIGHALGKGADSLHKTAEKMQERSSKNMSKAGDLLTPAWNKATDQIKSSAANIGGAISQGMTIGHVFDTSDAQKSMDTSIGKVFDAEAKQQADADKFNKDHKPGQQAPTEDLTEQKVRWGPAFIGTLMKIGGGGRSVGGAQDPILRENQKHTTLLQTIARNTALKTGGLVTASVQGASFL